MKNKMVTVAAIQSKVTPDLKLNLEKTVRLVEQVAKRGAQIICLQELYRTIYFPQYKKVKKENYSETIPGESTRVFSRIAKKYKAIIIVPVFEKDPKGGFHNSAAVINIDGKLLPTYRKIHIPQDPLFYEKNYFKESDAGYKIYKTKYATFAVLICYDQWFPEAARAVKLSGADIIFYPTAIGTIKEVSQKEGRWHNAWETIMRGHAIANSLYVVAVNRVGRENKLNFWGQSFVADAFGQITKIASNTKDEILITPINLANIKTIADEWGFIRNRRADTYKKISK